MLTLVSGDKQWSFFPGRITVAEDVSHSAVLEQSPTEWIFTYREFTRRHSRWNHKKDREVTQEEALAWANKAMERLVHKEDRRMQAERSKSDG